ncbi:hypothetical protein [Aeromonas caviae]|uniref:hypothetical protein n=1 Tax=Aeromonas caviae TaxID=648 RepID=UPI0025B6F304|nr:hypothetical protein [Aeromonas caviae]
MADAKRGGARPGAGRPKGETTTMVRVPEGCLEAVRHLISVYRNGGDLPVTSVVSQGDGHTQVEMAFSDASSQKRFDNSFQPPDNAGPLHRKAISAWFVFSDAVMAYPYGFELRDRYWQLAFDADELGYTYLFNLQLLERLVAMAEAEKHCPLQWCNIRELRQFAKQLYRANPQWH